MDGPPVIYALIDPRTQAMRYVGKAKDLRRRYLRHIRESQRQTNHRARWIQSVLRSGLAPDMVAIETTTEEGWIEAELFWIAYFRFIGADLVNTTAGGTGGATCNWRGRHHTREAKEKLRQANAGRVFPEWHKEKLRVARRGKRPALGMQHTDEARVAISRGLKVAYASGRRVPRRVGAPGKRTGQALENIRAAQAARRARERTGRV